MCVQHIRATESRDARSVAGAIELLAPFGGHFGYGLIGGVLVAEPSGRLTVQVMMTPRGDEKSERLFTGGLAEGLDDIRVGLPEEYRTAFTAGITLAEQRLSSIIAGRLTIDCAAHGRISSSVVIFTYLVFTLIKLLGDIVSDTVPDDLAQLFDVDLFFQKSVAAARK